MQTTCSLRMVVLGMVAALAVSASARAQNLDQTTLTFFAPMEVPGATLAPGAYVFELADAQADHTMVRIFNADHAKLIATAEVIPTKRAAATGNVIITYRPTVLGSAPTALDSWFYPGSLYGHQFVYPARQAAEIANRTDTGVVATTAPDGKDASFVLIDAYGKRTPWHLDESVVAGARDEARERGSRH